MKNVTLSFLKPKSLLQSLHKLFAKKSALKEDKIAAYPSAYTSYRYAKFYSSISL
jgi:hypothetical protein